MSKDENTLISNNGPVTNYYGSLPGASGNPPSYLTGDGEGGGVSFQSDVGNERSLTFHDVGYQVPVNCGRSKKIIIKDCKYAGDHLASYLYFCSCELVITNNKLCRVFVCFAVE